MIFLSETQCHLFSSNCAVRANKFSRRAVILGSRENPECCLGSLTGASQRGQAYDRQQF